MFDILAWTIFGSVLVVMLALSVGAVWFSRKPSPKVLLVAMTGVVVSLILAGCAAPAADSSDSTAPTTQSSNNIIVSKVEVSRWGFNKVPGDFLLEVEKGQEVEITFVWGDSDLPENNIHIVANLEYGLNTGILDKDNPEVTLRFVAEETGQVVFSCVAPECIGHHNLHTIT